MRVALVVAALSLQATEAVPTEYPGAALTRIGETLTLGRSRFRLAYFSTSDSVAKVARHFKAAWEGEGLPVTVDGDLRVEGVVSAVRTREGLMHSVVLTQAGTQTLAFSSVKDLWVKVPDRKGPWPTLEGELFAHRTFADGAQSAQQSAFVVARKLEDVRASWKTQVERQGFSLDREVADGTTRILHWTKGEERLQCAFVPVGESVTGVSAVWIPSGDPRR